MSSQGYNREERRKVETLLHRASHLEERITERGHSFDRAELGALGWALDVVVAARGDLPPDLAQIRADVWPA